MSSQESIFDLADRLRELPTCVGQMPAGEIGVHESCLRASQTLREVERLLRAHTPPSLVVEFIAAVNRPQRYSPNDLRPARLKEGDAS